MLYPDYSRAYLPLCFSLNFSGFSPRSWIFLFLYFADGFYLKISDRLQPPADPSFWFFFIRTKYWFFISGGILLLLFLNLYFQNLCSFAISYRLSFLRFLSFFIIIIFSLPRDFYFVKGNKKIKYTCKSLLCLSAGRWRWCKVIFSWHV